MRKSSFPFLPGTLFAVAAALPAATVAAGESLAPGRVLVAQAGGVGQGAHQGGAKTSERAALSVADQTFIEEAAMSSLLEVQLGQMAEDNAGSDEVRRFGWRMVEEHGTAHSRLARVVAPLGVTLPGELDPRQRNQFARLQRLMGQEFDRAYMKAVVEAHERDVASFRKQADGRGNADVRQFASTTLPMLQGHLSLSRDISKTVQGGAGKDGSAGIGSGRLGSGDR